MVLKSVLTLLVNYHILRHQTLYNVYYIICEINLRGIITSKMPKYAVARGYKIGIYDTWKECEEQVSGFHKPKFKKFDSLTEAEDFMKQNCDQSKLENPNANIGVQYQKTESFKVPKVSPASVTLGGINVSFHNLEARLNTFMQDTRNMLSDIQKRLVVLESQHNTLIPDHLVKKEFDDQYVELPKSTKRATDHEELEPYKVMKFSSEQSSIRTTLPTCTSSESNSELCQYIKSEDGFVNVYTDGACSQNGRLGAKAGIGVWFNNNHPLNVSEPVRGYATNNNAEIQAATKAILQASKAGITKLNVHTDSQFMIKCITSWIHKWKRNDWKLKGGGPVKNKEELMSLDEAIRNLECVKWTYVKGHSGDVGNTEADALARKGAEMYQCNITFGSK